MLGQISTTFGLGPLACRLGLLALGALSLVSCRDLDRFSTSNGEAYCGSITLSSRFREGLSPGVQMRLYLDAESLDGPGIAGTITTYEAAIDPDEEGVRMLNEAPLRVIEPILHDSISQLEFGEGSDRNALLAVSPAEESAESMLAILSLIGDGSIEVRLLRPGRADGDSVPPEQQPIYGLFPLRRRPGNCGF